MLFGWGVSLEQCSGEEEIPLAHCVRRRNGARRRRRGGMGGGGLDVPFSHYHLPPPIPLSSPLRRTIPQTRQR